MTPHSTKNDPAGSRGGLFMRVRRDDAHMHLTLTCATHWKDWERSHSITHAELETIYAGRFAVLRVISDTLVAQARHSLKTCACASPLFDPEVGT